VTQDQGCPAWLKIDAATGVLSRAPPAAGKVEVTVAATMERQVRKLDEQGVMTMPSNTLRQVSFAVLILTGFAAAASAEVKLAGIFGDHMVLQREMKTPVWGTAEPGEKIVIALGPDRTGATADAGGCWTARLDLRFDDRRRQSRPPAPQACRRRAGGQGRGQTGRLRHRGP
jgi:hypothetical protein